MQFSKKLNKREKEEYILISQLIWGCVPIDVDWAQNTNIYKLNQLRTPNEHNLIELKSILKF